MIKLKRRRTRIALAKYLFLELQQNYCNLLSSITTNDNWWVVRARPRKIISLHWNFLLFERRKWVLNTSTVTLVYTNIVLLCWLHWSTPIIPRQDELVAISNYLRFHSMDTLATADNYLNLIHFVLDNPGCVCVLRPGHRSLHCSSDHWYWSE